jgi:putative MATE family efflux protein
MEKRISRYEIDMVNGPLFSGILRFALPLALSGILQLTFNAADVIVVGQYAGTTALAAVGSTGALINLIINLFTGLSIGVNVLVANYRGAGRDDDAEKTVHTAILTAFFGGIVLVFVGVLLSKPLLQLMDTPANVIDQSVLYMRIYFMGMPAFMVYNFGAAIFRAVGDTKRPLYFLTIAGVVNVVLNLVLVIVFRLGVAGVAIATVASQVISAVLIIISMLKTQGICHLDPSKLQLDMHKLVRIVRIGLPAGLQGSLFSISNVLIQSSVNSFGDLVMAGNTAAGNLEGFVYTSMNALYQANLSFTGQNYGAHNHPRIKKVLVYCLGIVAVFGATIGNLVYLFGPYLLRLYNSDPMVIQYGMNRLQIVSSMYFLCGMMEVASGSLRGLGYAVAPMIVSLTGACALRILWIYTIFAAWHTQFSLYISYPISWVITLAAHLICFAIVYKKRFSSTAVLQS